MAISPHMLTPVNLFTQTGKAVSVSRSFALAATLRKSFIGRHSKELLQNFGLLPQSDSSKWFSGRLLHIVVSAFSSQGPQAAGDGNIAAGYARGKIPTLSFGPDGTLELGNSGRVVKDTVVKISPPKAKEAPGQGIKFKATAQVKSDSTRTPKYSKAARRYYNRTFREPERLSKVLAAAGVASRRGSEDIIFAGKVTVNGVVCKVPQTLVDPLKDTIYVNGQSLSKRQVPKFYFAVNKPKGYICSSLGDGHKPVLNLLSDYFKVWESRNPGVPRPRLFTVGRLDVATTGLILVTNDGDFAQRVGHPSSGLSKEYVVTVDEKVTRRQLAAIVMGTEVQGVHCVPTAVDLVLDEDGDNRHRIRITVNEGRNHEVRMLVANAGLTVKALKRVRIGGLRLSRKLGLGKVEALTTLQLERLLDATKQLTI